MFSSFFRTFSQQPESTQSPPSAREILEHSKQCNDIYKRMFNLNSQILEQNKEIINSNKLIMSEMRETARMLSNSLRIRKCPDNHDLTSYEASGGHCDLCHKIVFVGEQVMGCRECNWYMCVKCSRQNGFNISSSATINPSNVRQPQTQSLQTIFNELLNPTVTTTAHSELYTFDIPLNGQGFDAFITQLTQTLNELAPLAQQDVVVTPTPAQINKACIVMPASEANLSDQYVCPIDLSPIEDDESVMKIKQCGHVFRESNLRELFTRDVKCPMCRFDVRDHVEVTAGPNEGDSEDDILDEPLGTFD